jgi:ribosomal protein S18 acetylase RimI-like enzyme
MAQDVSLIRATSASDWEQARRLVEEYAGSLGVDLSFQGFADELEQLSREYGPPRGVMLLAMDGDAAVGCVGLRPFDATTGEIKRLDVAPAARGRALGRSLADAIASLGKELGYSRLVLDTLPTMRAAQALYASIGFKPIDPYRYNPVVGTVFMELVLSP